MALEVLAADRRDSDLSERFAREARALAGMSRPGITAVHDHGEAAGGGMWAAGKAA
ncbi:MAG: hypothetical protein JNL12_07915 [Planctomycetes bacterium]|nr:hypothetical protein [Planctomycetota bacterium]